MRAYFMVLELKTANIKIAELETKIQDMKEEKREQYHGELLFTIILYPTSMDWYTYR